MVDDAINAFADAMVKEGRLTEEQVDELQGKKYSISISAEEFDATRNLAVENLSIVMPNIANKKALIVRYGDEERTPIKPERKEIKEWAKKNVVNESAYIIDSNGNKHNCPITPSALDKYVDDSTSDKNVSREVHLLAMPLLSKILANSIEVEIHPDYLKKDGKRGPENGYNANVLIHRFYGAVEIEGQVYRAKSTVKEFKDKNTSLKPYSYEITKIELLAPATDNATDGTTSHLRTPSNSIDATKLLQNVEKSYDEGVKVLDESANYSLIPPEMDADYLSAVERGDMETAQQMVMEAAKRAMPNTKVVDKNGNPKVVYHQTNHSVYINRETGQNWDELDWRERMEWDECDDWDDYWEERDFNTFSRVNARTTNELDGFFFAPEYDEYHEYGNRTIEAFLNIENPASNGDYNIDASKTNAGRDERIRMQNEGYDGVINVEDGAIYEYIAFNPNQIKSADPVTYDDNGNVIPLSERFNPEKEDIRYSLPSIPFYDEQGNVIDMNTISEEMALEMVDGRVRSMLEHDYNKRIVGIAKDAKDARNATRAYYAEERRKPRKRRGKNDAPRTNAAKIDELFADTDINSLPLEVQALIFIAEGRAKIRWADKDGKKGLASELGLANSPSDRAALKSVWSGATQSFDEVVHGWWESINGYERGIDTQDLRNALIEAISAYPSAKAAMRELQYQYDSIATAEREALEKIDRREAADLERAKREYEETSARFEHSEGEERDYMREMAVEHYSSQPMSAADEALEERHLDVTSEIEKQACVDSNATRLFWILMIQIQGNVSYYRYVVWSKTQKAARRSPFVLARMN